MEKNFIEEITAPVFSKTISVTDTLKVLIKYEKKHHPSILKEDLSKRTDISIFIVIVSELP